MESYPDRGLIDVLNFQIASDVVDTLQTIYSAHSSRLRVRCFQFCQKLWVEPKNDALWRIPTLAWADANRANARLVPDWGACFRVFAAVVTAFD